MKEEAKTAREQAYLQRFREIFADFPDGEVVPSEHPDFLIKTRPQCIGIEITEYHVPEPGEDRGSPTRAKEGTEDKVLRRASDQHQSSGLPPLVVHVLWHPHQTLDRRWIQELAADLANLVQEHLPDTGHSVTIRHPHPASRSLPQEVASLTVVRRKSISKNSWTSVRGAFVPTLTPPELQQKVSEYLKGNYTTYEPRAIPEPHGIPLGNQVAKLEATALFIDMRQSSNIANAFRLQTAAKMVKAYFDGAVRISGQRTVDE